MAWEDRPYYRDSRSPSNPLLWLLTGSAPLFTIFNIRVRAHASLIVLMVLGLLFGLSAGADIGTRVQSVTILFLVVLLHEFGHCFAARWTGGEAEEILLTPLGGLAFAMARRRPWPTFVTVAGGPLVNVAICVICSLGMWAISHTAPPFSPRAFGTHLHARGWTEAYGYFYWFYAVSYALLIFNMIPVFPLDGGQMLQSILWRPLGYYRSMIVTLNIGLVGSVLLIMLGVATFGAGGFGLLLILIGGGCFINCFQMRRMMRAEGPWAFQDEDAIDYGASYSASARGFEGAKKRSSAIGKWKARRSAKLAREEASERTQIDAILAKVSASGMHSLSRSEKKTLQKASERQKARDLERATTRRRN